MIEKFQWTLKEIRGAYGEILRAYNAIFPLHPETRIKGEDVITDFLDFDFGDNSIIERNKMLTKISSKLKEAADRSGNAATWHRDEPLDGLNQSLRERIERALKLGI